MPETVNSANNELLHQKIDAIEKAMGAASEAIKERIVLSDQLREEKIDTVYEFVKHLYDEVKGLRTDVKFVSKTQHYLLGACGFASVILPIAVAAIGYLVHRN